MIRHESAFWISHLVAHFIQSLLHHFYSQADFPHGTEMTATAPAFTSICGNSQREKERHFWELSWKIKEAYFPDVPHTSVTPVGHMSIPEPLPVSRDYAN